MRTFLRIPPSMAVWLVIAPTVTASVRNSATYSIPLEVLDSGGGVVSSTSYTSIGSLGGIVGTAASPTSQAVFGMIGQIGIFGQIDTQAPVLTLPSPIIAAATNAGGVAVSFSITASDDLDPVPVILATPANNSVFPLGDTTVQVSATDNAGNSSTGSFPVKVLSPLVDGDGDGLNDSAEFLLASLGYDWQVSQPTLVSALLNSAGVAGLFTTSQVQALHTGTPLIARNPATGKFKLTMDWKKSTNLSDFLDFPAPAGSGVSITPQGDVEFEFPSTDNAAFYRIEVE